MAQNLWLRPPVREPGGISRVVYPEFVEPASAEGLLSAILNVLIRLWFGAWPHEYVNCFAPQHKKIGGCDKRFHWRTFRSAVVYLPRAKFVPFTRRAKMAWKTPKIVEVPVGMEINMYACAARK
jgi:coenzyme PQQ precursor peptide PqqA